MSSKSYHRTGLLSPAPASSGPTPSRMSPGQRWRSRRDLIIAMASQQGASQRLLGDVFDLPHSRISVILKRHREAYPGLCRTGGASGAAQNS